MKYNKMPPLMGERHKVLNDVYKKIKKDNSLIRKIFDFNKTIHADLDLFWMKPKFLRKEVKYPSDYQVVIATVHPGQKSKAHLHEKGASSLIVLGEKTGFNAPKNLTYRSGVLDFPSLKVRKTSEIKCKEGVELDIPPNTVHEFENKDNVDVNVLIVTHPVIYVKEGEEDIHFSLH